MNDTQKTVRWGIMGTADIATKVLRAMQLAPDNDAIAIASRTADRAAQWARERQFAGKQYASYQALLDDPDIDAIYMPLPPSMHLEWTTKAAQAGKHVLSEKPLAGNVDQAQQMIEVCQHHNVQLMDGTMWVHHPRTQQMLDIIQDGQLGELRCLSTAFSFCWKTIPEKNIRLNRELAGGSLGDLGWYCCRAAQVLFDGLPQRVYATARYYNDVDMNLTAILWYDNNRLATFNCGFDTGMRQWFELAGTDRHLVCDDFVLPVREDRSRFWLNEPDGTGAEHTVGPCVQESQMIIDFSNALRSGQLNAHWPQESLNTMRLIERLDQSARAEKPLDMTA